MSDTLVANRSLYLLDVPISNTSQMVLFLCVVYCYNPLVNFPTFSCRLTYHLSQRSPAPWSVSSHLPVRASTQPILCNPGSIVKVNRKGKFLYSAVFGPQDCSKRFTLYFPGRPVQSNTISTSLGSIQPYATINARRLYVHISTTVYSLVLIYWSNVERKNLAQGFNTAAHLTGFEPGFS